MEHLYKSYEMLFNVYASNGSYEHNGLSVCPITVFLTVNLSFMGQIVKFRFSHDGNLPIIVS